jgi:hypothetical protein
MPSWRLIAWDDSELGCEKKNMQFRINDLVLKKATKIHDSQVNAK